MSAPVRAGGARAAGPRGFTLLEVMLAIVLTSIAVLIAGSALRTASDTSERVQAHRDALERDARARAMLTDMLRHAPRAEQVDEPLLTLARDRNGDAALTFLSQGVRAPFGTGSSWRVTLSSTQGHVLLEATPIGLASGSAALRSTLTDAEGLQVQFLQPASGTDAPTWRDDWPLTRTRPAMIALRFGHDGAAPPLVVALDPLVATGATTRRLLAVRP